MVSSGNLERRGWVSAARLRVDARGRDGGVRQELAAGVVLRSGGRSAFGGKAENICLILSLSSFDRVVGPGADIPSPEQLVAAHIPLAPFQDPDGCETMPCVVLTPGGDYEAPGVHHAGRRHGGGVAACGARAAAGDAGDRISPWGIACRLDGPAAWISSGPEGRGLRRERERGDRVPLGGGAVRSSAGIG